MAAGREKAFAMRLLAILLLSVLCQSATLDKPACRTVQRSQAARHRFMRETGHPKGWRGHIVDHVVPLACGGADDPSNMNWQTVAEAKAKDKIELSCCVKR